MSYWKPELDEDKVRLALENCYMLARRRRVVIHRYDPDGTAHPIGPKSDDDNWDHIIRFCEDAGLRTSIIRTMEVTDK